MKKQNLNNSDASRIIYLVRNEIVKTLDEKCKENTKKIGFSGLPKRQLRQLEIIYGSAAFSKALTILREKRIKPCLECPSKNNCQQFKIYGSGTKIYHIEENSHTCQCQAFKEHFIAKSERFQCKHLLALSLLKVFNYTE